MLGGGDVEDAAAAAAFLAIHEGCELAVPDVGVLSDLSVVVLAREDVPGQFVEVFVSGLGLRRDAWATSRTMSFKLGVNDNRRCKVVWSVLSATPAASPPWSSGASRAGAVMSPRKRSSSRSAPSHALPSLQLKCEQLVGSSVDCHSLGPACHGIEDGVRAGGAAPRRAGAMRDASKCADSVLGAGA